MSIFICMSGRDEASEPQYIDAIYADRKMAEVHIHKRLNEPDFLRHMAQYPLLDGEHAYYYIREEEIIHEGTNLDTSG
jgi:hypothetical protein